jgi:hypothetical protein
VSEWEGGGEINVTQFVREKARVCERNVRHIPFSLARSLAPSLPLALSRSLSLTPSLSLFWCEQARESKSPVQIFQIDPENDGIESQRKELEAVFDEVASEVGPDVHPDRANSLGHVQQSNPDCSGLAHGARHDPRALNRLSRRYVRACVHVCVKSERGSACL